MTEQELFKLRARYTEMREDIACVDGGCPDCPKRLRQHLDNLPDWLLRAAVAGACEKMLLMMRRAA